MKYTKMYQAITKVLKNDGEVSFAMSDRTALMIELWSSMFEGKAPWLNEKVEDLTLAPASAGEIARLVTLELQTKVEGSGRASYIDRIYQKVVRKARVFSEYACAKGGLVLKPYVSGDNIFVQLIQADSFFPISFDDSGNMTYCVFVEQFREGSTIYSRVESHKLEDRQLTIRNRAFVARTEGLLGSEVEIGSIPRWNGLAAQVIFEGIEKLPLGYFRIPLANNIDDGSPLGVSVYSRSIGLIREADKRYSQINWEYESKETAIHIASSLLKYREDLDKWEYPGGKERLYRNIEYNTGAVDKPLIDAFSPDIRDASFFNGLNQQLRRIEFNSNLAYGTLSDPNNTDKTAEEIKASKQRSYSFVADCQGALQDALEDLVSAIDFWASIYHLAPPGTYRTSFKWDDSIIVDEEKDRQTDRADVAMGAMSLWEYRMKWYGETEEQAKAAIKESQAREETALFQEE